MITRESKLGMRGKMKVQHIRNGKVIGEYEFPNGITNVGLNHLLDVGFHGSSATATWYVGLIDNSGYSAVADSDTMSSHAGWNEFTTYSDATRIGWVEDAAASRAITNSTPSTFNINGSGTVRGVFITSNNTKSGTSGTLWATALFASTVAVTNGDQLKVTYTISG